MRLLLPVLSCICLAHLSLPLSIFSQTQAIFETTWWKDSETVKELNLSDAQIKKMELISQNNLKRLSELGEAFNKNLAMLRSLEKADPADKDQLRAQAEMVEKAEKEFETERAAMMRSFEGELSGEQRIELKEIQKLRAASWSFKNLFKQNDGTRDQKTKKIALPSGEEAYISGEGMEGPYILEQKPPPYTYEARRRRIEGIVVLQAVVRKDGRLSDITILQSPGYGLGESAMKTLAEKWRYIPAKLNGAFVNTLIDIEVSFQFRPN